MTASYRFEPGERRTCDHGPGCPCPVGGDPICQRAGHGPDCPGNAGAAHVLLPGWIAYEDADGSLIEIEVAS